MVKGKEVNFTDTDLHTDPEGPTAMEAPWEQFQDPWLTRSNHKDAPVAPVYTYQSRPMMLVRDENHRAYGLVNPTTNKVMWIPFGQAPFGIEQTETVVELAPYIDSGIAQSDTALARVLQKDGAPVYSVHDEIRKRGGDPTRRSEFKPKFLGNKRIR